MTTMEVSAHVCNFCDAIASFFKQTLKKLQYARQMEANRRVASDLVHLGFHNQKEYNYILMKMNDKTNEEYDK